MTELNIALVGCGRISGHHARSISQVDGIRLVAVCDLVADRATEYAVAHNVPAFESYHEMLVRGPGDRHCFDQHPFGDASRACARHN